jgi:hypothetical protein
VAVGMEVERGPEPLQKRDRPGVTVGDPLVAAAAALPGEERAAEEAQGGREEGGVPGEGQAEGPGEGQDPLAVGDGGENSVEGPNRLQVLVPTTCAEAPMWPCWSIRVSARSWPLSPRTGGVRCGRRPPTAG